MSYAFSTRVTLLFILAIYVLLSLFNFSPLEEDAYIYFRFVENITNGFGYVFNPQGEHLEACSSISWLFLLVFLHKLGFSIPLAAKYAGIFFGAGSLVLIYCITTFFTQRRPWVFVPSLLTAVSIPFMYRNQMGLETAIYCFVIMASVLICLNEKWLRYWPAVFGLLVLTRPEGFIMTLGLIPVFYLYKWNRQKIFVSVSVFILLFFALEIVRFIYFHDFLPTPFYFKIYPEKYRLGLTYTHMFFRDYFIYFFIVPLLFFFPRKSNWNRPRTILFGFMLLQVCWVIYGGAEFFPFFRQFVPFLPLLYIYLVTGLLNTIPPRSSLALCITAVYLTLYSLAALLFTPHSLLTYPKPVEFRKAVKGIVQIKNWSNIFHHSPENNFVFDNISEFVQFPGQYAQKLGNKIRCAECYDWQYRLDAQIHTGAFIHDNYPEGTTFVYDQMGRVPYRAGTSYNFIDSNGLVEKTIGRTVFYFKNRNTKLLKAYDSITRKIILTAFPASTFLYSEAALVDYVFKKKPDVILCYAGLVNRVINGIAADPRFKANYRLKYLVNGVIFVERHNMQLNKPLNIPEGVKIAHTEEIKKRLPNHPLVNAFIDF